MSAVGRGAATLRLPVRFAPVEVLGANALGTVWRARDGERGGALAVKVLDGTLSDPDAQRRFQDEGDALVRLSANPGIVTIHEIGLTPEDHPFVVMDLVPGGSLLARLRADGSPSWKEVTSLGVRVADALAAGHELGLLHRNLKPTNLLLDFAGRPLLTDFGTARLAEAMATTGRVLGPLPHTPPEVLAGRGAAPSSDVWALGAMLHRLLVGQSGVPDGDALASAIARVLRSEWPDLPSQVPGDLSSLVESMISADPEARPRSAASAARQLQDLEAAHGLPLTPARSTREVVDRARRDRSDDTVDLDLTLVEFTPASPDVTTPPLVSGALAAMVDLPSRRAPRSTPPRRPRAERSGPPAPTPATVAPELPASPVPSAAPSPLAPPTPEAGPPQTWPARFAATHAGAPPATSPPPPAAEAIDGPPTEWPGGTTPFVAPSPAPGHDLGLLVAPPTSDAAVPVPGMGPPLTHATPSRRRLPLVLVALAVVVVLAVVGAIVLVTG